MKWLIALAFALALGACASVQTLETSPARIEQVRERNYELGVQQTVVVGEPLVRVREHILKTRDGAGYLVKTDATGRVGMSAVNVQEGQTLPVVGVRDVDGVTYRVAMVGGIGLQVGPDGEILNKVVTPHPNGFGWIPVIPSLNFEGQPPVLEPSVNRIVETAPSDLNYEIVFNGNDGQSIRFQYREYTAENLARPAYFQDLTYANTSSYVRFRNLVIRVLRIGADDLDYIVEKD